MSRLSPRPGDAWLESSLSRRGFLRGLAAGGAVLAVGPALSACGTDPVSTSGPTSGAGASSSTVAWSNWPLYLDTAEDDENSYPTLAAFEEESGLDVEYTEDINSNDEFFGKISPQLEAGQSTGRDLVVLTDWMAGRLISYGWIQELDKANIPNAENLISSYRDLDFDPGRAYSLPWQSGMTGIGYNPEKLGREISTLDDLFQDDLKGRITMLSEMRDTMGLILLSMDKQPEDHTLADYEAAIAKLQKLVDDGFIRAFTGNEYAADLASGNIGAAVGWSGDVLQLQADDPGMQFVVPAQGGILWSDNLRVPKGAANKAGAERVIDHYYDPAVAAEVAAWVNYVTPVDGAQEAMRDLDPELADNELIVPTQETLDRLHSFKPLEEDEERQYQDLFQKVIGA